MDIVSKKKRSLMMSGISGKNTRPEITVRKILYGHGFRYRINKSEMAGKPDIVLPKYRSLIFVHGCFWHRHNCSLFKWPSSNPEFWKRKILSNVERDKNNIQKLENDGWRICTVWECSIKGKKANEIARAGDRIVKWLLSGSEKLVLKGKK